MVDRSQSFVVLAAEGGARSSDLLSSTAPSGPTGMYNEKMRHAISAFQFCVSGEFNMTDSVRITDCCAACLQPPRQKGNGESIPLLRCSRCRKVWYHDVECQRKHYKHHRLFCIRCDDLKEIRPTTKPNKVDGSSEQKQFVIENRPGKGRCMVALCTIPKAQIIHPQSSDSNYFQPLVPPVLVQSLRSTRCAVCFGRLRKKFQFEDNPHHPKYQVLLCSQACRQVGMAWLAQEERLIVNILNQDESHTAVERAPIRSVFPSAIFAYRVCLAMAKDVTIRAYVETLQRSRTDATLSTLPEVARSHALASILTVKRLLMETCASSKDPDESLIAMDVEVTWDIICKTKTNAFSVCDGEFTPIGLGIYPVASNINHSCRPNALQTFRFGASNLPQLRLTTCSAVAKSEEICISYIDNQAPRQLRQDNLDSYGFECTCPYCSDAERETRLVGLKCQTCGGMGRVDRVTNSWRCESCQAAIPELVLKAIQRFSDLDQSNLLQTVKQFHDTFRTHCFPTSWYFQQSASSFIDLQLDYMQACQEPSKKMQLAHSILLPLEVMLQNRTDDECAVLPTTLLRFKAAKVRLFLGLDLQRALQEMKSVNETLLLYFPPDHEILDEVRHTLGN